MAGLIQSARAVDATQFLPHWVVTHWPEQTFCFSAGRQRPGRGDQPAGRPGLGIGWAKGRAESEWRFVLDRFDCEATLGDTRFHRGLDTLGKF